MIIPKSLSRVKSRFDPFIDNVMGVFQADINDLPDFKWFGELNMSAISTQRQDKIDTLVKPLKPRIMIPSADEELSGLTTPGIPDIKLVANEKNRDLLLHISSGREVKMEEGLYKGDRALIPVKDVLLFDGGWEEYLPPRLLKEIYEGG